MAGKIERSNSVTAAIVLTASASTSPLVPFGAAATGLFIVDAVTGDATKINWHAALSASDTATAVYDAGSALSTSIAAGRAYAIPAALQAAPFVVGVTDAGTATIRLSVKG